jgi:glycerol-3-phosphate O-acyltransferase
MDLSPPPPPTEPTVHDGGGEPYVPIELYRSCMVRTWGILYYLFGLAWVFRALRLDDAAAERVRLAADQGPVVYVLRSRSLLDYLALNEVLRRRRLPLAEYSMAISMTPWMPFWEGLRLVRDKLKWIVRHGRPPSPIDVGYLGRTIASGKNAAVFLRPRMRWRDFFSPPAWPDPTPTLLDAQRESARPVRLVPVVVLWRRRPEQAGSITLKALIGAEDEGRWLWKLLGVATGVREARVQIGEPVNLQEYQSRTAELPPATQARQLRVLLRRFLWREAQLVRGPAIRSPRLTRRRVLGSPRVTRLIEQEALATRRPISAVQTEVLKVYDRMAARFSYTVVRLARRPAVWLFSRVYDGFDVPAEDVEQVRAAMRDGVCVLVPCHKSHVDYIVLSTVLHENDLVMPHVIAGDNLSFFPLGWLLRRFGAVFIKRSFTGERIFPTVFQSYLTTLFRDGQTVEFFIEGGRSRTGKLLPPKLGVLGATVDAGLEARLGRGSLGEVTYLPVAITYEQLAEEGPYARELSGAGKRPESAADLLRALKVLGRRQGRVHLRIGEPLPLSGFITEQGEPWEDLGRERRREALRVLGERLMHRINTKLVVTPTGLVSMALLAQRRPALPLAELHDRVARLHSLLVAAGAEPSGRLQSFDRARDEALAQLRQKGLIEIIDGPEPVLRLIPERRVILDVYKNGALHFLVPASLLAAELRARKAEAFTATSLRDSLRLQLFLLRYELITDPAADERSLEAEGLRLLTEAGAIVSDPEAGEGAYRVVSPERVGELAELTHPLLESLYLTARALLRLDGRDLDERALEREVLKIGRQYLAVQDVRRPEAVSAANIKNGLKAYAEDGVLRFRHGGGVSVNPEAALRSVEELRRLMALPPAGVDALTA